MVVTRLRIGGAVVLVCSYSVVLFVFVIITNGDRTWEKNYIWWQKNRPIMSIDKAMATMRMAISTVCSRSAIRSRVPFRFRRVCKEDLIGKRNEPTSSRDIGEESSFSSPACRTWKHGIWNLDLEKRFEKRGEKQNCWNIQMVITTRLWSFRRTL